MSVADGLFLLVGSSLLRVALLSLALARKLRRDRRESRSIEQLAGYAAVLAAADVDAIAAIFTAASDTEEQADLAVTIDALHGGSFG